LESGARLFEDDDAAVADRESRETRTTNCLSDNVEASQCDACLCQQAVAIIGVNQGTSGLGERRHDSLLCKLGHAKEADGEAGHIKDLRKAETTPGRHVKHNLTDLSTVSWLSSRRPVERMGKGRFGGDEYRSARDGV
jgi:hypothetical protein